MCIVDDVSAEYPHYAHITFGGPPEVNLFGQGEVGKRWRSVNERQISMQNMSLDVNTDGESDRP